MWNKKIYYVYKNKHCNMINLILNYLFFIAFHSFKHDAGSIEINKNLVCSKCYID